MKEYLVRRAEAAPPLSAAWEDPCWQGVEPLEIAEFRPESSDHRPRTRARLLHSDGGLSGIFRVEDRYVLCRRVRFQDPVFEDSCVEAFLQPKADRGYFNFEMGCSGALLATHITDHRRTPKGFAAFTRLTPEEGAQVRIRSSFAIRATPSPVDPEITSPTDWELSFFIPFALLESHVGPVRPVGGQEWRANFYKCGDKTSHPHWASWSRVDSLNFHLPECFGRLRFEEVRPTRQEVSRGQ